MDLFCPECLTGKHQNCDGVADLDANDKPIECRCSAAGPHVRRPNAREATAVVSDIPSEV